MSIALWAKVQQLETRLEAVERAQAAIRKPPASLAAQAENRHLASLALDGEIQALMFPNSGPARLTAKQILKLLGRDDLSIRTIQDHMKKINAASSAPRFCQSVRGIK